MSLQREHHNSLLASQDRNADDNLNVDDEPDSMDHNTMLFYQKRPGSGGGASGSNNNSRSSDPGQGPSSIKVNRTVLDDFCSGLTVEDVEAANDTDNIVNSENSYRMRQQDLQRQQQKQQIRRKAAAQQGPGSSAQQSTQAKKQTTIPQSTNKGILDGYSNYGKKSYEQYTNLNHLPDLLDEEFITQQQVAKVVEESKSQSGNAEVLREDNADFGGAADTMMDVNYVDETLKATAADKLALPSKQTLIGVEQQIALKLKEIENLESEIIMEQTQSGEYGLGESQADDDFDTATLISLSAKGGQTIKRIRRPSGDPRWQELQTRPDPTNVCRGIVKESVMPPPDNQWDSGWIVPEFTNHNEESSEIDSCNNQANMMGGQELSFDFLSYHWERLAREM